jgi:hypothetical protein
LRRVGRVVDVEPRGAEAEARPWRIRELAKHLEQDL